MEKYDGPGDAAEGDLAALLAGLTADPDADLAPEQVSALFAVALEGEPPSTVTAESVLREVRAAETARPVRFLSAEWFAEHATAWKWGGGLVAAAAVVGAFALTVPGTGGGAADSAAMPDSAEAMSIPAPREAAGPDNSAASKDGMDESSSSAESYQLATADQPMSAMDGAEAPAEGSMSLESAAGLAGDTAGGAAGDAGAAQTSEGYSGGADAGSSRDAACGVSEDSGSAGATASGGTCTPAAPSSEDTGATSPGRDCALPPLSAAEWRAAVASLPAGADVDRLDGAHCRDGMVGGNGIQVKGDDGQPDVYLWVFVSHGSIGRDGAATDSTVVSASRGDLTATVIANQSGSERFSATDLRGLVDAVLAAG